jgi:hypothetical protein
VLSVSVDESAVQPGPQVVAGPATLVRRPERTAASSTSISGGRRDCAGPTVTTEVLRFDVTLPAGTSSTIAVTQPARLRRATADPDVFVQTWEIAPAPPAGTPAPPPATVEVTSRPVTFAGLRPANVAIRVVVAATGRIAGDGERVATRSRRRLQVSGRVIGARRGDRVTIWRFSPGAKVARPLARVAVGGGGRYAHDWRPVRRGAWELYATYGGHAGLLDRGRSACAGPQVRVTR